MKPVPIWKFLFCLKGYLMMGSWRLEGIFLINDHEYIDMRYQSRLTMDTIAYLCIVYAITKQYHATKKGSIGSWWHKTEWNNLVADLWNRPKNNDAKPRSESPRYLIYHTSSKVWWRITIRVTVFFEYLCLIISFHKLLFYAHILFWTDLMIKLFKYNSELEGQSEEHGRVTPTGVVRTF